jgi:hypothetical protein
MVKKEHVSLQMKQIFRFFVARICAYVPCNPSELMKKERLSFFILFVEIAAIILLHSAKNRQTESSRLFGDKKTAVTASYQFKALTLTKVK